MRFQMIRLDETHEAANVRILMHLGIYGNAEMGECGNSEMRKWGNGELGKCGNAEMEECGNGGMRKCGNAGENVENVPLFVGFW